VDVLIAPVVGPEVVMGSTRLKAATAQKMVLNMLTTATMILSGKVYKGMMVDLQMSCKKLSQRAIRTIMTLSNLDYDGATAALSAAGGSVKRALVMIEAKCSALEADSALEQANGMVRVAIARAKGSL
jgi:N-acetylmuramic acid 6-phosphate etherase